MTRHLAIGCVRCGGDLRYVGFRIIANLSQSRTFPMFCDLNDCTSHLLRFKCLVLTSWESKTLKEKFSYQVIRAQIGVGMSFIHLYFDIRHNCNGRVVNGTRVPHFTPMKIPWESFPLEGGCTPKIMNSNIIGLLENFPWTSTYSTTVRPREG